MKKLLLSLIIVSTFFQSFSQSSFREDGSYLVDSIIETHSYPAFFVGISNKDEFRYNPNNDIRLHDRYTNTNEYYEPVAWKKTEKTSSYFDEQDSLKQIIWQNRSVDEEDWANDKRTDYSYEPEKKITINHLWDDSIWLKQSRVTDSWNAEKRHSSLLIEIWKADINNWKSSLSYDTIFTADGMFDTITYFVWVADEKETAIIEAFDYTFYPDTIISQTRNGDMLDLTKKYQDTALNTDIEITYRYIDSTNSFRPSIKQLFYLDNQQNIIRDDRMSWNFNALEWELSQRIDYHYNTENLLDEKLVYGPGSIYIIFEKRQYYYNDLLLLHKEIDYFYPIDDDSWTMYEYYYTIRYVDVLEKPTNPKPKLYPNPANNSLYINNSDLIYQKYQIFDLNGSMVKSGSMFQQKKLVDISSLPTGNYVLTLQGEFESYSAQFVKL